MSTINHRFQPLFQAFLYASSLDWGPPSCTIEVGIRSMKPQILKGLIYMCPCSTLTFRVLSKLSDSSSLNLSMKHNCFALVSHHHFIFITAYGYLPFSDPQKDRMEFPGRSLILSPCGAAVGRWKLLRMETLKCGYIHKP